MALQCCLHIIEKFHKYTGTFTMPTANVTHTILVNSYSLQQCSTALRVLELGMQFSRCLHEGLQKQSITNVSMASQFTIRKLFSAHTIDLLILICKEKQTTDFSYCQGTQFICWLRAIPEMPSLPPCPSVHVKSPWGWFNWSVMTLTYDVA